MAISSHVFQQLIQVLEKIMPISPVVKMMLMDILFEEFYTKGTRILYQREIQSQLWFIINGSAREFKEDKNAGVQEQTLWFSFNGDLLYTIPGFFSQTAAPGSIELLEDSHLIYLDIDDYQKMEKETNLLFSKIRDHYEASKQEYQTNKLHLSGKDKYLQLFTTHPSLFNNAKMKDIAYFLGISANSLSRLRKNK
ncbi:cyclic nucleotide-binding domain-containing protein [Pedobacter sp. UYP1]|uniref:Crp/Fnr family transcriptional regulator n=1 Tax=Pedobacter sp. UYP1 TaxID=1756396 RepID=UPI0033945896